MNRKIWLVLTGCLLCSVLLVMGLYYGSSSLNHRGNGFIRLIRTHIADGQKMIDIGSRSFYIAGVSAKHIYLGNYDSTRKVLLVNYALTDTQILKLDLPERPMVGSALNLRVDTPYMYLMEGLTPSVFRGGLSGPMRSCSAGLPHFSSAVSLAVSSSSLVQRTYDRGLHQNILTKVLLDSGVMLHAPGLLTKQSDGIFCTDGMLHYDREAGKLVYVYFYRNQFICFDTSMNLLYRGKTIDTISRVKIRVADVRSENQSTLASPPLFVNKTSCAENGRLYINSGLMANNETRAHFEEHPVIDVYDLKDGKYQFSFYIPGINGNKMSFFRVFNKTLVVIQDHYLLTYTLRF